MRLTSFTDYSLRVLMYLALKPERLATIPEIARAYDVSENHLMKVTQLLTRSGAVASVRGKGGGIRLARPAQEIRLGAIVREAEGNSPIVECLGIQPQCNLTPACRLKGVLTEAFDALYAVLDKYTLADMVSQPKVMAKLVRLEDVFGHGDAQRPTGPRKTGKALAS
ncbi:RrF2 family transcriptional regulator [Propionivibrio soli]|uniref:RrF2 family transcriptional regulator n=1 Tax=Propionivibrio soli TaxID=2976531 RepID=UPI0021E7BF90|nr:Rrf2 family transcriptional regulator [Propionivibrio soli]